MSVQEIKEQLAALPRKEQDEVMTYFVDYELRSFACATTTRAPA
jgi:hypothetical protein